MATKTKTSKAVQPISPPKDPPAFLKGSAYSQLLADRILERICNGETLRTICLTDGYPAASTVTSWYVHPDENLRPGFAADYERAERIGLELMAQDLLDISDDSGKDKVTRVFKGKRVTVIDQENINRDRLRVQTRQWFLERRLSKLYGDRVQHEHSGEIDLVARLQEGRKRVEEAKKEIDEAKMVIIEGTAEEVKE
jgi:hypothetical protein